MSVAFRREMLSTWKGRLNVLSPALTLSRDEIDRIVSILRDAIEDTMAELDREGFDFAA